MSALCDQEGYLLDLSAWNRDVAETLAEDEGIELSDAHWELILLVREFFQEYELSPSMRPLVKRVARKLGREKGRSIYLLSLFPGNPAKSLAKVAGLPRPTNCI